MAGSGPQKLSCLAADKSFNSEIGPANQPPPSTAVVAAIERNHARLRDINSREFIAECLRIVSLKAAHAADNVWLADDLTAERDIELAISNLREGARTFREMQRIQAAGQQ
jgi:hypothetical protein